MDGVLCGAYSILENDSFGLSLYTPLFNALLLLAVRQPISEKDRFSKMNSLSREYLAACWRGAQQQLI